MKVEKVLVGKFNNKDIISYNLRNSKGFGINVLNYGGIITDVLVPDKNGTIENVVLKYKNIESYKENPSYYGALIGRTAGRIANATTKINDENLILSKNYGENQGHGGSNGFYKQIFLVEAYESEYEAYVELSYLSKDGEEGYPGNLNVKVRYTVNENNEFKVTYKGISDKDTLVNLTHHCYFNLSGNCKDDILNHYLYVSSDFLIELNNKQVPTGKLMFIEGTPFDFNTPKKVGKDIEKKNEQLEIGQGYDHPWVLKNDNDIKVKLYHEESGRVMDIYTNQDAVVLYSLNYPDDKFLDVDKKPNRRDGLAIETQNPPIGESNIFTRYSILRKNEEYNKETVYKFSVL